MSFTVLSLVSVGQKIRASLANQWVTAIEELQAASAGLDSITSGTGSPEGVVTAPVGDIYRRTDGAADSTLYVKESGSGNTGWQAYASKALVDVNTADIAVLKTANHFMECARTTTQSIAVTTFTTVTMTDVTDPENLYNGTVYTVPEDGTYMCISKVRADEDSLGQGVHTSNIDGPWFSWGGASALTGTDRYTNVNVRIAPFSSGDQLRLYTYGNLAFDVQQASLTVYRIGD